MSIYASSSTVTQQTTPRIVVDPATVQEGYILVWDAEQGVFVATSATTDDSGNVISIADILRVEEYDANGVLVEDGTSDQNWLDFDPVNGILKFYQPDLSIYLTAENIGESGFEVELGDLYGIDIPSDGADDGQVLTWNHSSQAWEPQDIVINESDISLELSDLTDVTITLDSSNSDGDVLAYDHATQQFVNRPLTLDDIDFPSGGDTGDILVVQSDGSLAFEALTINIENILDLADLEIDWDQIAPSTLPDFNPTPAELFDLLVNHDNDSTGDSLGSVIEAAVNQAVGLGELADVTLDDTGNELADGDGIAWNATSGQWEPVDLSDHNHAADDIIFDPSITSNTLTGCVQEPKVNSGHKIIVNGTTITFDGGSNGMVSYDDLWTDIDAAFTNDSNTTVDVIKYQPNASYIQFQSTTGNAIVLEEVAAASEAGYEYSIVDIETDSASDLLITTNSEVNFDLDDVVVFSHVTGSSALTGLNKNLYRVKSKLGATFTLESLSEDSSGIPTNVGPNDFGGIGFVSSKPFALMGFELGTHYVGQLDDALIGENSIKQHSGALEIYSSQIVDFDSQFRVELDLEPNLGGDLDLNGFDIFGASTGDNAQSSGSNIYADAFIGPLSGDVDGNLTGDMIGDVFAPDGVTKIVENGSLGLPMFKITFISDTLPWYIEVIDTGDDSALDPSLDNPAVVEFSGLNVMTVMNGRTVASSSVEKVDGTTTRITFSNIDGRNWAGTYNGLGKITHINGDPETYRKDAYFYGRVISPEPEQDNDGNYIVDPDSGTLVGTLYGNVVGGTFIGDNGSVSGNFTADTFTTTPGGKFIGNLDGNICADDGSIILEAGVDSSTGWFAGSVHGSVKAEDGTFTVLNNSERAVPRTVSGTHGGRYYAEGDLNGVPLNVGYSWYDRGMPFFKGEIRAVANQDYNDDTDVVIMYPGSFKDNIGSRNEYAWDAWFRGSLVSTQGETVLDNGLDGTDAKFFGDVWTQDGEGNEKKVLENGSFEDGVYQSDAWFLGDLLADDGSIVVETGSDGSDAKYYGDVYAQDAGGNQELILDVGSFSNNEHNSDATFLGDILANDGVTKIIDNGTVVRNKQDIQNISTSGGIAVVTTATAHGYTDGETVRITDVDGELGDYAEGLWNIDTTGYPADQFQLLRTTDNGVVSTTGWSGVYNQTGDAACVTQLAYAGNATYQGDIIAEDGVSKVLDNGTDGTDAWFAGDLYAQDSAGNQEHILHVGTMTDSSTHDGNAWFAGDLKAENGTIVLQAGTDGVDAKFTGTVCGDLVGDIWAEGADPLTDDAEKVKVFNNGTVTSDGEGIEGSWFKGDFIGSVKGDVQAVDPTDPENCITIVDTGTWVDGVHQGDALYQNGNMKGDIIADDMTTVVFTNGSLTGNKYDISGFNTTGDTVTLTTSEAHNIVTGETVTISNVLFSGPANSSLLNTSHTVTAGASGGTTFEIVISDADTLLQNFVTSDPLGCVRNDTESKFDFNIDDDTGHAKFYGAHYGNIYAAGGTKVGENGTDGTDAWYAGDLRNPDNTIVLNVGRDNIEDAWFIGDLMNTDGDLVLDVEDSAGNAWFYGHVVGPHTGDILAEDGLTRVLDNGTDGTDAWFMGDIKDDDGDVVVAVGGGSTPTMFTGELTGDVYNEAGTLILDVDDGTGEALICANVKGNIVADDGTVVLENGADSSGAVFYGRVEGEMEGEFTGDILADDGTLVFENGTDGTDAAATADIYADDGTQVLENGTDGTDAWFIGDIKSDDSTIVLDVSEGMLYGDIQGDVYSENGTKVLENGTDGTDATFTGDLTGDVYNEDGALILETGGGSAEPQLNADVNGDLTGDVYDNDGDLVLDIEGGHLVTADSGLITVDGALYTGTVQGDIYDNDGNKIFDAETGEFELGKTPIPIDQLIDVFVSDYGAKSRDDYAGYYDDADWDDIFDSQNNDKNDWTPTHGQPLGYVRDILDSGSENEPDWIPGWVPLSDIIVDSLTAPTIVGEDISTNTLVLPYNYDTDGDGEGDTLGGIYDTAGNLILNVGDADNTAYFQGDIKQTNGDVVYDSIANIYSGGIDTTGTGANATFGGTVDLTDATVIGGDKFGIKKLIELDDTYEPTTLNLEVLKVIQSSSTIQPLPQYNGVNIWESANDIVLYELNGDAIPVSDYTVDADSSGYTGNVTFTSARSGNFNVEYIINTGLPVNNQPLVWADNYENTGEGRWYPGTATDIYLSNIDFIGNVDMSPQDGSPLQDGAYLRWDSDTVWVDPFGGSHTGRWIVDNGGNNLDTLDDIITDNLISGDSTSTGDSSEDETIVNEDDIPALVYDPDLVKPDGSTGAWRPSSVITEYSMNAATSGYEFTAGFQNRTDGFVGFDNGTNVDYTYDHVDNKEWMRFGFSDTNQVTVDTPYWADTTDPSSPGYVEGSREAPGYIDGSDWANRTHTGAHEDVGAFGGAYMPGGVRNMFDFDDLTDYNLASSAQTATQNGGLNYNAAQGSLRMDQLNAGDKCMFRFDFNIIPQVVNTTVEVGLIWSTRSPNNTITYTFSLTTQPLFFGQGTIGKTFLNRPLITAYIASGEDINARALPAIRCSSPVLVQPLSILYTVIR